LAALHCKNKFLPSSSNLSQITSHLCGNRYLLQFRYSRTRGLTDLIAKGAFGCLGWNRAPLAQRDGRPARTGRRPLLAYRLVACAAPVRTELQIVWMLVHSVSSMFSHITYVWLLFWAS
jgi:hypothetical protein